MSALSRTAHRHPFWLIPIVALMTAGGFLVIPQLASQAAPPPNDTCASPVPLTMGTIIDADSSQAANDYQATTVTDTAKVLAPSAGPDLVFRITLTGTVAARVVIEAPFNVTTYATSGTTSPNTPCGKVEVFPVGNFALGVNNQILLGNLSPPGVTQTIWTLVVDGWTPTDKGAMKIVTGSANQCTFSCETNSIGTTHNAANALDATLTDLASKSTHWTFSESSTRDGIREFITLSSPTTQDVTITYNLDPTSPGFGGTNPVTRVIHLVAGQRKTVTANDAANGGAGPNLDFSFTVDGASAFDASAAVYVNRDVGLGIPSEGLTGIQGDSN